MRKIVLPLAWVALVVLLSLGISGSKRGNTGVLTAKPNIVFILADDMRKDDLKYMPKTRSVLKTKGMSFSNAFVSNPLCCPARATIMRGQYAHNTGVWSDIGSDKANTSEGGWKAYRNNGLEQDNVATRLDAAGYRTGLFGKYLNGYNQGNTYIPPGWDRWFGAGAFRYFDYDANDQGTIRHFGGTTRHFGRSDSNYVTDVVAEKAKTFISTSAGQGKPFFAYVAPIAPHGPATPAPRDRHTYDDLKAPRPPSFNEKGVSEKPPWIRSRPRLTPDKIAKIKKRHEARVETLQSLDDMVAGIVRKLKDRGVMGNTYVFFTSDNGWAEGEHRRPGGKANPYEEDVRMPLLVRGPGVAAGSNTSKLALNTDYLPTFADLACSSSSPCDTQNWRYVPDGRSLLPVLKGNATNWRSAVLLEGHQGPWKHAVPAYAGIRTVGAHEERKYLEYETGERELYYLGSNPHELNNRYPATMPSAELVTRLQALKTCAADSCRAAEDGQ
jgi:N-acetylglucosamine-6-sulfatase